MENYTLYTCGTRGTHSSFGMDFQEFGGATTCYVLKKGTHAVVIDCGTGLYNGKHLLEGCTQVDVVISHLHYDHIIGLLEMPAFPENVTVTLYGNFSLWVGENSLDQFFRPPFWPISLQLGHYVDTTHEREFQLTPEVELKLVKSNHPNNTNIARINTNSGSVCFAFDYEHNEPFPDEIARGCDILFYDGMYTEEEYPPRKTWGHSVWQEGVKVAKRLGIPQLIITHHAPVRTDEQLRELEKLAKEEFPAIRFARMGDSRILERSEKV